MFCNVMIYDYKIKVDLRIPNLSRQLICVLFIISNLYFFFRVGGQPEVCMAAAVKADAVVQGPYSETCHFGDISLFTYRCTLIGWLRKTGK